MTDGHFDGEVGRDELAVDGFVFGGKGDEDHSVDLLEKEDKKMGKWGDEV